MIAEEKKNDTSFSLPWLYWLCNKPKTEHLLLSIKQSAVSLGEEIYGVEWYYFDNHFLQSNTVNVSYFAHLLTTQWPRWKKKEHSIGNVDKKAILCD